MRTSTIVTISVGTVVTGLLAYAVCFDYKRRNDPEFRKALKRESRRQARIAKEEAEVQGKKQREEVKRAVQEAIEEGFPTDIEEKEAFFMQQIAQGEALAGDGSDPVGAALCFYKGLKVYPEPSSLIGIYDNTVPKDILEILAVMVAQDKNLKVGSFGASNEGASDSGPGVE
ncbi:mitochondrial import receptor subunit tom20 [Elasticomyces elasticus]|uniref:Mitochondrial import receptor subunit tom20 n=1 Tax=Exophiala sideris TaxID=1016849 RepID=A0ABR0JHR4_9EURO|nr:mitochondrial import receptor subunit tom20 [Elasticomyces elasticus]KAK5033508.1 mitochondrial import receptor subunit tom20 [Exophiala sideris]KAK5041997.1 mitochondrial import receptor subunit tom20 [Exophiala sideris]KAK5064052.1 mitochondrial import receptor subunit tom20 [Exophiala sideris]KAK5185265.1 mitochondrial import receptor subunit tom20 [Eurotiomycetes sp. CCFEE 6388]